MKLMILDGNSIVNRAFYGVRLLTAPDGTPTNGVFGFLSILQKLLTDQEPDAVCVAFDVHAPTFRHKQYAEYKGKRKPMPEDLVVQMPLLKEVLQTMGISCYECAGWEADDILGTVGKRCEEENWDCLIVTGDKDSFQLVTDTTHVFHVKSSKGQTTTTEYTPEVFQEEYGFAPIHIIDLKALMGDSSDNIPGVPGVGEKTATALIQNYSTISSIYSQLDTLDVKDGIKKKLEAGKESAEMSYDLATIRKDVPIDFDPKENVCPEVHRALGPGAGRRDGILQKTGISGVPGDDGIRSGLAEKDHFRRGLYCALCGRGSGSDLSVRRKGRVFRPLERLR